MKRKLFLLYGLICLFITASAQKEILNKEETINYINKKVAEGQGHTRSPNGTLMYYWSMGISMSGDKAQLSILSSNFQNAAQGNKNCQNYFQRQTYQSFNPAHIVSITQETNSRNEPLGSIIIRLKANTGISRTIVNYYKNRFSDGVCNTWTPYGDNSISTNEIGLVFLQADPDNFKKIKRALEHLRDLCKAEDDPFGD